MVEFVAIEKAEDFPKVTRTSAYKKILKDFLASQLQRAEADGSDLQGKPTTIRSALKRTAKKMNLDLDIVVDENKKISIRKV